MQRNDLDRSYDLYDGFHLHSCSCKGVGTVTSYRDFLALKGIKPIVIERTPKSKGDKVIVTSCKPAETVR